MEGGLLVPGTAEGGRLAELHALERAVALLQEQAALLATETPPPSPSAPAAPPNAASPDGDELIRALEEAVASLRSASGGSPDEARERARVLAELARDLERARVDAHSRRAEIERQRHVERELHTRDRALADLDRDERARREHELADRERQRTVERHRIERSRAVDDAREEALERQIEALELRQAELQRVIEELRRSRGRLLE